MSKFGDCMDGHHVTCPKSAPQFYIEIKKGKGIVVFTGEDLVCDCYCHGKGTK